MQSLIRKTQAVVLVSHVHQNFECSRQDCACGVQFSVERWRGVGQGKSNGKSVRRYRKKKVNFDSFSERVNFSAWLNEIAWDNVTEMDKLQGFHGVIDSFEQYSRDWYNWYTHTEPETLPLIGIKIFFLIFENCKNRV